MKITRYLLAIAAAVALSAPLSAQIVLRQSTAVDIGIGAFVDATDGVTAETGLTLSQADVRLKKNGGAWAQKNDSNACTHEENGWYECALNTTDTDTVGILVVNISESGALPVWVRFQVIEEAVYDQDYVAAGTGRRPADVTHWTGSDLLTGTGPLPALGILDRGNLQADSTTTNQLRSAAAFADDELVGATNILYSATTGAGQRCLVSDYVGSTDTATCSPALVTDPTGTVRYELYGTAAAAGITAPDASTNADAVGDEALSGHSTSGTSGERLGRVPNAAAGGNGGLPTVNASNYVAGVQVLDEDLTTVDLNATAVGSVTGNVTGSVGSVATGGLTAASFASDSITAAKIASDVAPEIVSGIATSSALSTVDTKVTSLQAAVAALNNLSAAQLRDLIIEDQGGSGISLGCALAAITAYVAGDLTTSAGSSTYKDASGGENRITGVVSSPGNRLGTIVCPTY
jgi:hypothetical protein